MKSKISKFAVELKNVQFRRIVELKFKTVKDPPLAHWQFRKLFEILTKTLLLDFFAMDASPKRATGPFLCWK